MECIKTAVIMLALLGLGLAQACTADADCPSPVPGPHYYCNASDVCEMSGMYKCNTDADCQSANEGTDCAQGTCLYVSRPPPGNECCPIVTALVALVGAAVFLRPVAGRGGSVGKQDMPGVER